MDSHVNKKCNKNVFPMDADILPPSDDRIFKTLLTHPDAKQVLIDVISTVIESTVVDVHIRGNEVPAMDAEEKNERFDVNCTINTGDQISDQYGYCRVRQIEQYFKEAGRKADYV